MGKQAFFHHAQLFKSLTLVDTAPSLALNSTQQVASVTFLVLLILSAVAAYMILPATEIKIPRRPLREQVYYIAMGLESVVMGFLVAYTLHLFPCFYENCHLSTDATASAVILISVWPVSTVGLIAARTMGYNKLSLFEKMPSTAGEELEATQIGASFFSLPSMAMRPL